MRHICADFILIKRLLYIPIIRSAPRAPQNGARGAERGCEGQEKGMGKPDCSRCDAKARPPCADFVGAGRARTFARYVRYAFICIKDEGGLCLASLLEPRLLFGAEMCALCVCRTAGSGGAGV